MASFVPNNPGIDLTILRVVGGIAVASDQSAGVESQLGAFGMIVVTDRAFAAGIASIPGPITDGDQDGWFVYQSFARDGSLINEGLASTWWPIDSKAKRIITGEGITVAIVVENIHATHAMDFFFQVRMLAQVRGTS